MQISITISLFTLFYLIGFIISVISVFHEEYKAMPFLMKVIISIGWPVFIFAAIINMFKEAIVNALNDKSK